MYVDNMLVSDLLVNSDKEIFLEKLVALGVIKMTIFQTKLRDTGMQSVLKGDL